MDKSAIIKKVTKIIRKYLSDDYKIMLFGSWAKNNALETSDIDIGILGKEKVPWSIMVKMLEEIDGIPTLRSIDVVDLQTKEETFKSNIMQYAKTL